MGIGIDSLSTATDITTQGIVPRAISALFNRISFLKSENSNFHSTVSVSFLELYNEELVDLLNPRPRTASSIGGGPTVREDGNGKIVWLNLSEEIVTSPEELFRYCKCTDFQCFATRNALSHYRFNRYERYFFQITRYIYSHSSTRKTCRNV